MVAPLYALLGVSGHENLQMAFNERATYLLAHQDTRENQDALEELLRTACDYVGYLSTERAYYKPHLLDDMRQEMIARFLNEIHITPGIEPFVALQRASATVIKREARHRDRLVSDMFASADHARLFTYNIQAPPVTDERLDCELSAEERDIVARIIARHFRSDAMRAFITDHYLGPILPYPERLQREKNGRESDWIYKGRKTILDEVLVRYPGKYDRIAAKLELLDHLQETNVAKGRSRSQSRFL